MFVWQEEKNCGAPCHAMFFAENERTVLRYWVGSWAALCCASCLFTVSARRMFYIPYEKKYIYFRKRTSYIAQFCVCVFQVLTFLIDPSRFRYPERAIVFLAVCYLVVGCAFVAGLGAGDSVACREPFAPPPRLRGLQMVSTITQVCVSLCARGSFVWQS